MGIQLTSAKDAGDLDGVDYRDIRISKINWNLMGDILEVTYQLGNFDDTTGEWTPGVLGPKIFVVKDEDPDNDYTTFFDETFKTGADTVAERMVEMLTNLLALRLGFDGVSVKPGRSGKKKI